MKSFLIAFSMYSKIPVPQTEWTKKHMSWALCWFPAVGLAVGGVLALWLIFADFIGLGTMAKGAIALIIPFVISGGIHLDGLCDTADALGSHQSRERKLAILQDSHIGAFALIVCGLYLIVFFAFWCEIHVTKRLIPLLSLVPVLSRCLSALGAVTIKNARGSGLLAAFTEGADIKKARLILVFLSLITAFLMIFLYPLMGAVMVSAALLSFLYYNIMSRRVFGGITGDLAGFFLQICELSCIIAAVLAQAFIER